MKSPIARIAIPRVPRRLLAAALLALAPGVAQAAPTWLPAQDLPGAGEVFQTALDGQGDAVALGPYVAPGAYPIVVRVRSRPAGGVWTSQDLSDPAQRVEYQTLAADGQGDALAIWGQHSQQGPCCDWKEANRAAGGDWSQPRDFSPNGGHCEVCDLPQVALDAHGNAVAVWNRRESDGTVTLQAATRPLGGFWSQPQNITTQKGFPFYDLRVAVDSHGAAVAIWESGTTSAGGSTTYFVKAVSRPAGGGPVKDGWGDPVDLTSKEGSSTSSVTDQAPYGYSDPQVALDGNGDAVAIWRRVNGTVGYGGSIQASTWTAGGGWTDPQTISSADANTGYPQLAVDLNGDATAVWTNAVTPSCFCGTSDLTSSAILVVQTVSRPANGNWTAPQNLSDPLGLSGYQSGPPRVAVNPRGDAVAIWGRHDGGTPTVEAASRPAGGSWSTAKNIHTSTGTVEPYRPRVAVDEQGNALAIWTPGDTIRPQAAGFDAAGPQLRALSVPGEGSTGSPLSFSVSPVDVWSAVASTGWDFGDGSGADGASVSHTYLAPGGFPVAVRSVDSLGNVSSETRSVAVQGPGASVSPSSGSGSSSISGVSSAPGAVIVPATGGAQLGVIPVVGVGAAEARRLLAFRRCMRLAGASTGAVRLRAQRRCVLLYGRTPGRVLGLRARALGKSVALSFLAPGSDGVRQPAARSYVIKQSTRPIVGARAFGRARSLCAGSCRFGNVRLGQRLSVTVRDLRSQGTYFYAVRARDNVTGRPGLRSRTVAVRTR